MSEAVLSPVTEARVRDFFALLKPKVMTLVIFTGAIGMALAPGFAAMNPFLAFAALLCLAVGAGAAGAINMWYDRDIDAVMTRTQNRPVPAGRVVPDDALAFGMILSIFSVMTMGLAVGWMAAGLLAFSIFFYAVIYTMGLKRHTPQNIVIGGAAGAFPPLIGWVSVTGAVDLVPLVLFAIIFFWTPPHFWALSLFSNDDFRRAKLPMMNLVRGERATKIQMLVYTMILLPLSLMPTALGATGWVYAGGAALLSSLFIVSAVRVLQSDDLKPARAMFGYSIIYLFVLFALMLVDKV